MTTIVATGLSDAAVAKRVAEGKTNDVPTRAARSVSEIVRANVFTRINAILGVLLIIVLSTGSIINGAFGLLIIANSAIGIIQELRAKQTLDKLAIVGQAKPLVRRESGTQALMPSEVVLDDIIELGPGDQIVVDGEIVAETNIEVDESLLTGEADPIAKDAGDMVMSGSFVVAGSGAYRATKVGREAYAAKLAEEASKFTLVKSELRSGINKILQFIGYLLVPAGLLTIYTQLFTTDAGWRESVLRMVGALVPMVPEGLVLMTSIAFAVGVIRLGRRQCLVQELPAIEGLARVDVVCADKTGTLTENGMRVSDLKPLTESDVADVLASLAADDTRPNASMQAIAEAYPTAPGWTATASAPFKSATKWSGASYGEHGNWVIGAPDVLLDPASPAAERAEQIGSKGLRVLLVGFSDRPVDDPDAPGQVTPAALVVLEQRVRPDARDTLDYFASQKVSIKVISGDNAVSVGAVAGTLGLHGETMDARKLPDQPDQLADTLEEYTTFGRVRPDQKRAMVHALQSRGHTVAMTGDGVNDVLALKDADIGVAMGAGSSASRTVAQIVLLDNKFATLALRRRRGPPGDRQHRTRLQPVPDQDRVLGAAGGLSGPGRPVLQVLRIRSAVVPVPAHPRHDRGLVHHRHPGVHPVAGPQQRAGAPGFRAPGDAFGAAVGCGGRHRHLHLLPGGLPGPRGHAGRADAGVDGGADHPAGELGVGARGGGAAV